jgi:predicted RNA-binding Zn-ribbon protein involved in translation (DUF1610 family)
MAHACPECGHEVEYRDAEVRLLTGTCTGCGKSLTVVAGAEVAAGAPAEGAAPAGAAPSADAPRCAECDTPLIVRTAGPTSLEAECPQCATTLTFVQPGDAEDDEDDADEEEDDDEATPAPAPRAPRYDRPRDDRPRGPRGPDRGFDRPPARPCRQCGAPLRFSTNPRGEVVGECDACGNRFTLPPRRDEGGFRGGGKGPPRGRYGSGDRRGPPRGRPYGRPPPRYGDRDDDRRKRRRPRDDD